MRSTKTQEPCNAHHRWQLTVDFRILASSVRLHWFLNTFCQLKSSKNPAIHANNIISIDGKRENHLPWWHYVCWIWSISMKWRWKVASLQLGRRRIISKPAVRQSNRTLIHLQNIRHKRLHATGFWNFILTFLSFLHVHSISIFVSV